MRVGLLVGVLALGAGCGGRAVTVRTGEATASEASIAFTNNLTQAVNVYVVQGTGRTGGDLFLRQVAGGATETLPVRGVATGASIGLKATTVDGTRTYSKENVVLARAVVWQVP
jgi:hypothetical protein